MHITALRAFTFLDKHILTVVSFIFLNATLRLLNKIDAIGMLKGNAVEALLEYEAHFAIGLYFTINIMD